MADITQTCTQCGKKFLIVDQEQEFLKKKKLPFPTVCPSDRQAKRLEHRGERALYKSTCQECGERVIVSYDPAKAESKILCKKCYLDYFEKHDVINP